MLEMALLYLKNELSNSVVVGTVVRDGKNRISPRDSLMIVQRGFVTKSKIGEKAHWYNFISNVRKRNLWLKGYSSEVDKLVATHGCVHLLSKSPGNHALSGNLKLHYPNVVREPDGSGCSFLPEVGVPVRTDGTPYDYYPDGRYCSYNQLLSYSFLACEQDGYLHHTLNLLGAGSPSISSVGVKICREYFWRNPSYELAQHVGYNSRITGAIGIALFTQQRFPVLVGPKVLMFSTVERMSEYLSKVKDHSGYIVTYMDIPRNFLYIPTRDQAMEIAKVYYQGRETMNIYDGIEVSEENQKIIRTLLVPPTYSYFPSDIISNVVAHAKIIREPRGDSVDISNDEDKRNSFLYSSGTTPMAFPLPLVRNMSYENVMIPAPVIWDGLNGLYDLEMVKNISRPVYVGRKDLLASQIEGLGTGYVQLSGGQLSLPVEKVNDLNNFVDTLHRACQNLKSVEIAEPLTEADMIDV